VVRAQYVQRFGRLGEAVVESNMTVMTDGFERVREVPCGELEASDRSSLRGIPLLPKGDCSTCRGVARPEGQAERTPLTQIETFDSEFRAGFGYDQPASALASVGIMAAATGDTASKYVARLETPVFLPENCTQCMECIVVCPDTAMPNTAQNIDTVLRTAVLHYVEKPEDRKQLLMAVPEIDSAVREAMRESVKAKTGTPFVQIVRDVIDGIEGISDDGREQLFGIVDKLPFGYYKANAIFATKERREAGDGGLFSIAISDLCKGCGACVSACGDHDALRMEVESEELNAEHETTTAFLSLLPDTPQKYLGLYDGDKPQEARVAALRNHLMVRRNYDALVSGDGACAGCGEKSVLRAIASVTEAYMRPIFHAKAERFLEKARQLEEVGQEQLAALAARDEAEHALFRKTVAHVLMGLGGDSDADTEARIAAYGTIGDEEIVGALVVVLREEAFHHKDLQAVDGRLANGMSVMAMGAHTGCNTVFGSTPPNNPHPYPWMNSLFQDGSTISWIIGEGFIKDHSSRSVIPERLADALLDRDEHVIDEDGYFTFTHFSDTYMTDQEIVELPKVWAIGGDGGMGDIGYQNLSKMILQNRPNVKALMLDTQVYSNTGGQNSDSSLMLGGFDMNQMGRATQGKLVEKKGVAETLTSGHGSAFVAQTSIANPPKFYKAILDALEYRGAAFLQCFTTCQPEHGVGDDMALVQAQGVRDSRCMPEFVMNPSKGETYQEAMDISGNPSPKTDWYETKLKATSEKVNFTVAHWCTTEARFRRHFKAIKEEEAARLIHLDRMLVRITQDDVVHRRYLRKDHRSYVPDFGVYIVLQNPAGGIEFRAISRQLVLFCVERRKSWRLLQSKAGVENLEYRAQRAILADFDSGELAREELFERGSELLREYRSAQLAAKTGKAEKAGKAKKAG
jgi:pyruvate-ferredoxin/flavodoxin oxidoreductase